MNEKSKISIKLEPKCAKKSQKAVNSSTSSRKCSSKYELSKYKRSNLFIDAQFISICACIGHKFQSTTSTKCDTKNEHNSGFSMENSASARCCKSFTASHQSYR